MRDVPDSDIIVPHTRMPEKSYSLARLKACCERLVGFCKCYLLAASLSGPTASNNKVMHDACFAIKAVTMITRTHLGELKEPFGRWLKACSLFIIITVNTGVNDSVNREQRLNDVLSIAIRKTYGPHIRIWYHARPDN